VLTVTLVLFLPTGVRSLLRDRLPPRRVAA
jgi:hypothetical protein